MKRKLAVFSLFVILMAVFVATIRNAGRRSTGVTQSLIATQDGRMTVLQQPASHYGRCNRRSVQRQTSEAWVGSLAGNVEDVYMEILLKESKALSLPCFDLVPAS